MVIEDETVREVFRNRSKEGKISCSECFKIAQELKIPTNEIASTLTELHIKIIKCQLGCFH
jgi:LAO/AO transport system kinase